MTLPDEMRRLTRHFLDAHDTRMEAVAGIRTATAQELAEYQAAHQAMAEELRAHLDEQEAARLAQAAEDARGRVEYVDNLRESAANQLKELDAAHQAMAAELRAHLDEQESGRQAQAAEDAQERAEYVATLQSDTAAFLQELDAAHQTMAAELRAHLDEQESARLAQAAEDARGRMEYVDNLRESVANLLKELDAAHQAMAAELRANLDEQETARQAQAAEDAQERAEYVATLKSDTAAMLSDFQAELDEARRVWSNFTILMQQRRARKPAVPPPPPPVEKVVAPPRPVKKAPPPPPVEAVAPPPPVVEEAPAAEEVAPDDLTTIRGIGSSMQRRLNQAGIYTYAQLAASKPEELRQTLGTVAQLAKVEEWIEQAREMA